MRAAAAALLAALAAGAAPALGGGHSGAAVIAYVTQSRSSPSWIWVANADGSSARRLFKGNLPLVAPDGRMVAGQDERGVSMLLYSTSGSQIHDFKPRRATVVPIAWSPDSRYLAVQLYGTALRSNKGSGIGVIDTSNDTLRTLAPGTPYGASFTVDGSDRLVYALSRSLKTFAPVDLYEVAPDGSGLTRLTTDGRSLNPLCGAKGIVFDRETPRGRNKAPVYQLWLMNGATQTQLTHMRIPALLDGLVPLGVSADGNRLIASYEGQDTGYAWTVQISPLRVHRVLGPKGYVQAAAISSDGRTLLLDSGAFEQPASRGTVFTALFPGVKPVHKLARGAFPSWNG